jgi:hypothetical protein
MKVVCDIQESEVSDMFRLCNIGSSNHSFLTTREAAVHFRETVEASHIRTTRILCNSNSICRVHSLVYMHLLAFFGT